MIADNALIHFLVWCHTYSKTFSFGGTIFFIARAVCACARCTLAVSQTLLHHLFFSSIVQCKYYTRMQIDRDKRRRWQQNKFFAKCNRLKPFYLLRCAYAPNYVPRQRKEKTLNDSQYVRYDGMSECANLIRKLNYAKTWKVDKSELSTFPLCSAPTLHFRLLKPRCHSEILFLKSLFFCRTSSFKSALCVSFIFLLFTFLILCWCSSLSACIRIDGCVSLFFLLFWHCLAFIVAK